MDILYTHELPVADNFFNLFQSTGWNGPRMKFTAEQLFCAIRHSWYTVSAYKAEQLVGFGRVVSDGVYQTFICDVIILPDHQRRGIGTSIMNDILNHCRSQGIQWIQLSAAQGKSTFYRRFGFTPRPDDAPGMQLYL